LPRQARPDAAEIRGPQRFLGNDRVRGVLVQFALELGQRGADDGANPAALQ
jgi:hypothetical protein